MRSLKLESTLIVGAVALALVAGSAVAQDDKSPQVARTSTRGSMASMPLEEILRLYRENEASRKVEEVTPPFPAALRRVDLEGRLLDEAVDLRALFEVVVLSDRDWVSVPLLRRDATITLLDLPTVAGGVLALRDDELNFVTRTPGTYRFQVALLKRAKSEGRGRNAELEIRGASLARLLLQVDEGMFRVAGPYVQQADGMAILPREGRFSLRWERIAETPEARPEAVLRPPTEPVIIAGHGSVVSTLEGKAIVRLLYELRFEGTQTLTFELPEGHRPLRVFLNGVVVPFSADGADLEVRVEPRRAGDQSGSVELVSEIDQGGFHLSGELLYTLPRVSWPVNEIFVVLHLPEVFNYSWIGGSLSPHGAAAAADFTHGIPTPGKELSFHQYLISKTSPTLRVDYTIDLTEQYFTGSSAGSADPMS